MFTDQLRSLWPDIDEDVEIEVSPLTEDDLDDELRQRIEKELQNDCRRISNNQSPL